MRRAALFLFATATTLFSSAMAQVVPTGVIIDTLLSTGLNAPNDLCFLPDGRILIANRPGQVTVYANGQTATVGTVPNVQQSSEQALLSVCPDPAFATNGHIYVWYASTLDNFMHLDRFTCTGDLAVPTSTNLTFATSTLRVVINNAPDNAGNHNGGTVRFGPDGKLYLTIGDDASSCQAQVLNAMQGKLLRMDVSQLPAGGSTTAPTAAQLDPGDNPLSANTDFSQLVIAQGLRNPVRMEIDPLTGSLYIGDVGQNAWEEYSEYVYSQPLQLVNFGWPWREGPNAFQTCTGTQPSAVGPIGWEAAGAGWASVMGGALYRNQNGQYDFGPAYEGCAFFGDYFAGQIRRLTKTGSTWGQAPTVPGQPSAQNWATGFTAFTSLRVGPDGALYMTQHPSTYATSGGFLKRLRPLGPVNNVLAVSGSGQAGPAREGFPLPLVVQVRDHNNQPLPAGVVNFAINGGGTLSTTNPVTADPQGRAQTFVTAGNLGGAITVTATTPGNPAGATFNLFSRKITITGATSLIILQISNTTAATPPNVPFIVFASAPGIPPMQTPIGPLCTDPFSPLTFVVEDSIGVFGFASLSGSGANGNPGIVKIYNIPVAVLRGVALNFQAVGLDPVAGPFRTDCELKVF